MFQRVKKLALLLGQHLTLIGGDTSTRRGLQVLGFQIPWNSHDRSECTPCVQKNLRSVQLHIPLLLRLVYPRLAPIRRVRRMRSSSSGPPPSCTRSMRRALSMGWARETSWKRGGKYLRNQSFQRARKIDMFCIMIQKMTKKICVKIIIDDQEKIWYVKVWDRCDLGGGDRADRQHNPSGFHSSTYHVICITLSSYHVSNKNHNSIMAND